MAEDAKAKAAAEADQKRKSEVEEFRTAFDKKKFTAEEVSKHDKEDSLWVIIYGAVYDMTEFQNDHPGGPDVLQDIAGMDATEEFENILHTEKARKMGNEYILGSIEGADFEMWLEHMNTPNKSSSSSSDDSGPNYAMIIMAILAIVAAIYFYNNQSKQAEP